MNRRALIAGALAGAMVIAGGGAMAVGWWTPWAAGELAGVDVSSHQGLIDWRALAHDDVHFAYIKATEGGDYVDPNFVQNWRGARAAGLPHGAYHYFTLCRTGREQAAHFIATVPREAGMLPPAVDMEHKGPCRRGPTMPDSVVVSEMHAFLDALEQHYGVRPILYTTREFHDAHLMELQGERFWLRSLFTPPNFRQHDWVIWQHHNGARKRGVATPIDLNAFRGDEAALQRFAASGGAGS